jgi:DNA-binding GntR family transcriptional regulator
MTVPSTEPSYTSLVDKAYEALRADIALGKLGAGYPILEQELADRLNMSRTPVRSAIEHLVHDGLVERVGRKGIFVKPLMVDDVEQSYEAAEGLEGMLVKLATIRAGDTELRGLEEIARCMQEAANVHDLEQWLISDREFHKQLGELGDNPMIVSALSQVHLIIERVRAFTLSVRPDMPQVSADEHVATVRAMLDRDAELARKLHQAHWQRVREEVISILRVGLPNELISR